MSGNESISGWQTGGLEEHLDGGNAGGGNAGGAVRVGETVRRVGVPWTPAVHALLSRLSREGFPGSPRPLGTDSQGREILTFLDGWAGSGVPG